MTSVRKAGPAFDSDDTMPMMGDDRRTSVAVMIPCFDEALTIGKVIEDFRRELPDAAIYVFDNGCTDDTAAVAARAGATVIPEPRRGKGNVVDAMFDTVRADIYVMVDGDDTYPAEYVHQLIEPVLCGRADMVSGARLAQFSQESFRPLHVAGNNLVRRLINAIFGAALTDILTGFRAFNDRVVRRIPIVSSGFEVETELTAQMLHHRMKILEVSVPYRERPEGSVSKLSTFRDGARVLWKIFHVVRSYKPLPFFGAVAVVLFGLGLLAGAGPIIDYIEKRYVYRVPMAILATGLMILSAGSFFLGILLHAINARCMELHNVQTRRTNGDARR